MSDVVTLLRMPDGTAHKYRMTVEQNREFDWLSLYRKGARLKYACLVRPGDPPAHEQIAQTNELMTRLMRSMEQFAR